jgi:hypothetical protein
VLSGADGFEVLGWSLSAKGLMWPVVVEAVCEGVDEGLQLVEAGRQVEGGVELVAPRALGALDAAVELGSLGRQDEEVEALVLAGLEAALNSDPPSTWMPLTGKGASATSFSRRVVAQAVGGEVLHGLGRDVHEQGVDLEPGLVGFRPLASACRSLPVSRKRRPPGLRRSIGTG